MSILYFTFTHLVKVTGADIPSFLVSTLAELTNTIQNNPGDWIVRTACIPHIREIFENTVSYTKSHKEGTEIDSQEYCIVDRKITQLKSLSGHLEE